MAKITYTYNGKTFTTSSQRVAKAAAAGHMEAAYRRYLSDTVGRQLRSLDRLSKANRLQYLKAVETGRIAPEQVTQAVKEYQRIVQDIVETRMQNQYQDVLNQLQGSEDPAVKKLVSGVQKIISTYADRYRAEDGMKANKAIKRLLERAENDVSEKGLRDLQRVQESVESLRSQMAPKEKLRKSKLAKRRK